MSEPQETQIEPARDIVAALRAGIAMGKPRSHAGCKPYTIVPDGARLAELPIEPANPTRIKALSTFDDAPSFIAYTRAHMDDGTHLFANVDASQVVAVLDHSKAAIPGPLADPERPRYASHRVTFTAKHSEEWKTWIARSGKAMSQVEFATFLEDNAPDILQPSGAELIEIAEQIQATRSGEFKSKINRTSSSVVFGYTEETSATAKDMEVPKEFQVQLRPYLGCSPHPLIAKLRFKLDSGKLLLWFDLIRHEQLRRLTFDTIIKRIADETTKPVLLGTFVQGA